MITRRSLAKGAGAALIGFGLSTKFTWATAMEDASKRFAGTMKDLEAQSGGRLGVAVIDTGTGLRLDHRANERFPMGSTFKMLAAAAVLARVDAGQEQLERRIRFDAAAVVPYSPITQGHAGGDGLSLAELCAAAITVSDNTAGNLLLASLGGPAGLTRYVRTLGDRMTRLDRTEPTLNEARPGDARDTTTPAVMAGNLRALALGTALTPASKERLIAWLVGNKTGDARLRAGLPKGWRVGDKTGSSKNGTANDVGVVWPEAGAPFVVSAYLTGTTASDDQRNATLAAVARTVVAALGLA